MKYGTAAALSRGDLALGYVTGIGKAGCFVQIGHKCTVRAGLNELSDSAKFNFADEIPVGRLVLGRITKVDTQPNGEKRYHFSTRQSLVVYGVGAVDRSKLQVGNEVTSIVMAVADQKAFCQIKGTYIKLKVKQFGNQPLKPGDHVVSTIKKLTAAKISSIFLSMSSSTTSPMTDEERLAETVYNSL